MRIALVYDAIYPFMVGGAERRYYELGRRLAQRHEVHLIGWQYWPGDREGERDGMRLRGIGRPVAFYDSSGRRTFREAASFALRVLPLLARERFDIVDCSSVPYAPVLTARLAGLRPPLVVTWLEYMGRRWQEYLGRGGRAFAATAIESACARVGRLRVAISDFTAKRLPERGPPTVVIPNGINYAEIEAAPPAGEAPCLLFVGRLVPHKRVDLLLTALSRVDFPCSLGIVGEGPEEARLRAQANELGLDGRVRFYGSLERSDSVYGLMKSAGILVQPSEQEGQSIVVLEAMACGLPVVVVKAPDSAAHELVEHGVTGLVVEPDDDALAGAICSLLENATERRVMGEAAKAVGTAYDWSAMASRTESAYETLV